LALTKVTEDVRTLGAGEVAIGNISGSAAASAGTFLKQDGTWAEVATDTTTIEDDIALLGFKVAVNGASSKYNLVDQTEDAFVDTAGVDLSASVNEIWNAAKYFSGVVPGNYFGDGSDGALTTSGNVTHTVANKVGSYDGDMVVKQYTDLTISAGHTMTIDQPNRGMMIMCTGDCVINGALSMSAKGGNGNPTASGGSDASAVSATGLRFAYKKSGETDTLSAADFAGTGTSAVAVVANMNAIAGDGKIYTVGRAGGAGGAGQTVSGAYGGGNAGTTGVATLSSGGGGSGGGYSEGPSLYIGGGATGSVFSGGPGGGGAYASSGTMTVAGDGGAYGGAGGQGGGTAPTYGVMCGGAGNPGGAGEVAGGNGTGGLLILVVAGDLTIGASGSIQANGVAGGSNGAGAGHSGGGGSGGGKIITLYVGTLTNNGTITSTGGAGGVGSASQHGADGAAGHIVTESISTSATVGNMTLVSTATEAETAPTKGDLVMTYTTAGGGSTTVGTDLTAEVSADDGSTWTDLGLVAGDIQGTTGGHTIISKHDVTISTTITAPYKMRYRVKTINQSTSKDTRIQAVSLGWS
jgi:hypothetical protein